MPILALGALLWLVVAVAAGCIVLYTWPRANTSRLHTLAWISCMLLAVLLLFRPHEDIFGGQDQGGYLNAAAEYARHGSLFFRDPLLADVPQDARPDFLYRGHGNPRQPTTLGALKVHDLASAVQGPYFQPAFPVAMAVVIRAGEPASALYVTPLFALLAAVAIWALAAHLFENGWAALAAMLFYLLNPITAWHGRCVRAEMPASFLVLSGLVLLLQAWRSRSRLASLAVVLAACCMAMAPFFHITAWLTCAPACAVVAAIAASGRPKMLAYIPVTLTGLCVFAYQTCCVTDPYRLEKMLTYWLERPFISAAAIAAGTLALVSACALACRARRSNRVPPALRAAARVAPAVGAVVVGVLGVGLAAASLLRPGTQGVRLPWIGDGGRTVELLTELRVFVGIVSAPVAAIAAAGWLLFVARRGNRHLERLAAAAVLLPGAFFVGRMPIAMYFLRRALPFLVPLFALSLTALVASLRLRSRLLHAATATAATVVLLLLSIHGRLHLWTHVDYRGLAAHVRRVAETVKRQGGITLFEYSRLAAPFNHMFGAPALGLDNERLHDYSRAEEAWEHVMRSRASSAAFFATPFDEQPLSGNFVFDPVEVIRYTDGERLGETRRGVPKVATAWQNAVFLYRMMRREDQSPVTGNGRFPHIARVGSGNMASWRGLGKPERRDWTLQGMRLSANRPFAASIDAASGGEQSRRIMFFLHTIGVGDDLSVRADATGTAIPLKAIGIGDGWFVAVTEALPAGFRGDLLLRSTVPVLLAEAVVTGEEPGVPPAPVRGATAPDRESAGPLLARKLTRGSRLLVPIPRTRRGYIMIHAFAAGKDAAVSLLVDEGDVIAPGPSAKVPGERWSWLVFPFVAHSSHAAPASLKISAETAPGSRVLVRCAAVIEGQE